MVIAVLENSLSQDVMLQTVFADLQILCICSRNFSDDCIMIATRPTAVKRDSVQEVDSGTGLGPENKETNRQSQRRTVVQGWKKYTVPKPLV